MHTINKNDTNRYNRTDDDYVRGWKRMGMRRPPSTGEPARLKQRRLASSLLATLWCGIICYVAFNAVLIGAFVFPDYQYAYSRSMMKEGRPGSANGRITSINIKLYQSKSDDDEATATKAGNDPSPLGSLDTVLEKARKRQGVNFQYKLQAIWESPLIRLDRPYAAVGVESSFIFTKGDAALTAVALLIHAKGFAFGYIFGKLSMGPLRELLQPSPPVQLLLMPLWTVFCAIFFDQIFA